MGDGRGGQTLGEEYVNAIPKEVRTGRIVTLPKRLAWILLHVLGPYSLTKLYAAIRRYSVSTKEKLDAAEARARARARALDKSFDASAHISAPQTPRHLVEQVAASAGDLAVLRWVAGVSFGGAFDAVLLGWQVLQCGAEGDRCHLNFDVSQATRIPATIVRGLGVLLGIQLSVKLLLEVRSYRRSKKSRAEEKRDSSVEKQSTAAVDPSTTVVIDDSIFSHASQPARRIPSSHHTSDDLHQEADANNVDLLYPHLPDDTSDKPESDSVAIAKLNTTAAATNAQSTLQCTLCMDQRAPHRGSSAVTECGHCFDWSCITAWIAEKPECPLCRQPLQLHRILPIYNF